MTVGEHGIEQGVSFTNGQGLDTLVAAALVGVILEAGLLDNALLGHEGDKVVLHVFGVLDPGGIKIGADAVVGFDGKQVLHCAALGCTHAFGKFVDLEAVAHALFGKEEHGRVHVSHIDMLDEIFIAGGSALLADSAAGLRTEFGERGTLDISKMGDGDDHILIGVEVFRIELVGAHGNFAAAGISVLRLHLGALIFHDLELESLAAENLDAVGDELLEFVELGLQFLALESCELAETHLDDGLGLGLGETELADQPLAGLVHALGCTDVGDYLIDNVNGFEKAFQDVGALLGLVEVEFSAAHNHLVTEVYEVGDNLLERERARTALYQSDVVDGETALERSVFEKGIEHHVGIGALLDAEDDADALAGSLVVHVGDTLYLLVFHHGGDAFEHFILVHHVWNLGDHDGLLSTVVDFDIGLCADDHAAAAGGIGIDDALAAHDQASCREVRALDMLHEAFDVDVGVVNVCADGIAAFTKVVGSHVGGHTHGNAGRTVQQQKRKFGGQDSRLFDGIVEVQGHVNRILIDIGDYIFRHFFQFGFGISHCSDRVAVHASEVALAVHKRITLVPPLGEARHGIVHGTVSMRMELTQHFTYDTGGFLGLPSV